MLIDMMASDNVLVELHSFVGETCHLTSTCSTAAERARSADVIRQSVVTILTGCNYAGH